MRQAIRRSALSVLGALSLVLTLGFAVPTVTAQAGGAQSAGVDCVPADVSSARVVPGSGAEERGARTAAEVAAAERDLRKRVDTLIGRGALRPDGTLPPGSSTFKVRTHFHILTREDGTGAVSMDQIHQQMRVLNQAFAGTPAGESLRSTFSFKLASITETANDDWADMGSEYAAKAALRRGGWADLNIYVADIAGGVLGYAYLPGLQDIVLDGVVVTTESLPRGSAAPYNEGDTVVHEVGHWLGLYHTFDGGCGPTGDFVADTAAQDDGANIFSCDESLDTCPQPGNDPVHNFMSYGTDLCMDRFTAGQDERMVQQWLAYREGR